MKTLSTLLCLFLFAFVVQGTKPNPGRELAPRQITEGEKIRIRAEYNNAKKNADTARTEFIHSIVLLEKHLTAK